MIYLCKYYDMVGCITCAGLLIMYNVKNTTNCFRGQNPYEYCTHNTDNYYFFNSYIYRCYANTNRTTELLDVLVSVYPMYIGTDTYIGNVYLRTSYLFVSVYFGQRRSNRSSEADDQQWSMHWTTGRMNRQDVFLCKTANQPLQYALGRTFM